MINQVILALDGMKIEDIHQKLERDLEKINILKIGLELYTQFGNQLILEMHTRYRKDIFLDLKLHDIPSTISKTIKSLKGLPIKFLTLHLSGGKEMVLQANKEATNSLPNTTLLGVTILTSLKTSEIEQLWGINLERLPQIYQNYFKLALETKIGGVVCSGADLAILNQVDKGHQLIRVCPGIRFIGDQINDQTRVMDPSEAFKQGADYLVIGRALSQDSGQSLIDKINYLQNIIPTTS